MVMATQTVPLSLSVGNTTKKQSKLLRNSFVLRAYDCPVSAFVIFAPLQMPTSPSIID
jgi:hypothetical protein